MAMSLVMLATLCRQDAASRHDCKLSFETKMEAGYLFQLRPKSNSGQPTPAN
jgi:hypothetical protein